MFIEGVSMFKYTGSSPREPIHPPKSNVHSAEDAAVQHNARDIHPSYVRSPQVQMKVSIRNAVHDLQNGTSENDVLKVPLHRYVVIYLLWWFGGWFGLHRFYMGRWFSGTSYAFTLGFLGLGWALDGSVYRACYENIFERNSFFYQWTKKQMLPKNLCTKQSGLRKKRASGLSFSSF